MAHNISFFSDGRRLLLLFITLTLSIVACRSVSSLEPELSNGEPVRTTIAGTVVDEEGMPLANVAITAHGQSTVSNEFGYFVLPNVLAPKHRALVQATREGCFTAARAATASEDGLTEVLLNMMSYGARTSVNASSGGTVRVTGTSGEASVRFVPNGMTVNGEPYAGEARVAVRYLDPVESNFANYFAGDETAIDAEGRNAMLVSYGVLRVDMRTPSGEIIQPASGKPAEVSYPIPSTLTNPPDAIPLWFFDEKKGLWVEYGVAARRGSNYVGTVEHFTDINLDIPEYGTARVTGRDLCGGHGMGGVVVRVNQAPTITNEDGYYSRRVPANTNLEIKVQLKDNDQQYASELIVVPPIPDNEETTVHLNLITGCPATITGTLTDGEGNMIPGAVTMIKTNGRVRTSTSLDGSFEMKVPAENQLQLTMSSWTCGLQKTVTAQGGESESVINIGAYVICSDEPSVAGIDVSYFDTLNSRAVLSPNGEYVAVAGQKSKAFVYNTNTGKLVSSTEVGSIPGWTYSPQFSQDGKRYLLNRFVSGDSKALVIETATGSIIKSIPIEDQTYLFPDGKSLLMWEWVYYGMQQRRILSKYSIETGTVENIYDNTDILYAYLQGVSQDWKKVILNVGGLYYVYNLDLEKIELETTLRYENNTAVSYGLSPDATLFSYVDYPSREFRVLDIANGAIVSMNGLLVNNQYQYSFHPNGRYFLRQPLQGEFSSLSLVDFRTGEVVKILPVAGRSVLCGHMSISREGKRASGIFREGQKLVLRVWDL